MIPLVCGCDCLAGGHLAARMNKYVMRLAVDVLEIGS